VGDLLMMLTQLGFGEYEARAYVALLQRSPVNGYELARQSGVPRGSIYGALARLEEKGAVVRLEAPEGTRYAPVATSDVLHNVASRFQHTLESVERELAELSTPPETDSVWNTRGYPALLDHARTLAESARQRLMLAVWPQESAALSDQTAAKVSRGVQIRTLCLANCAQECGHCRGTVYRSNTIADQDKRWLLLIADGREVLAAEISPGGTGETVTSASAVRTRQRLLVSLANRTSGKARPWLQS
jgi:sugar-specific transcriptional regulator TrmB